MKPCHQIPIMNHKYVKLPVALLAFGPDISTFVMFETIQSLPLPDSELSTCKSTTEALPIFGPDVFPSITLEIMDNNVG